MKKNKLEHILIYLFVVLFICACSQDDGNYDYVNLDKIDFSTMTEEETVLLGETLFIEGNFASNANEADLSYVWYVEKNSESSGKVIDTISTAKDLNVVVDFPLGDVELNYNVYNKALDVKYEHVIDVKVSTVYLDGWGILKEKSGKTELDFISNVSNEYILDNLKNISGIEVEGAPVQFDMYPTREINKEGTFYYLNLLTQQNLYIFDLSSMQLKKDAIQEMFSTSDNLNLPFTGASVNFSSFVNNRNGLLFAGGKLYPKAGESLTSNFWGGIVEGDYQMSNVGTIMGYDYFVFYDGANKRYLYIDAAGSYFNVQEMPEKRASDAFDPRNLGKECLWLDAINLTRTAISILKDDSGVYYLQMFDFNTGASFTGTLEVLVPQDIISANSVYLNNGVTPHTYITNNGLVGRFTHSTSAFESGYISDYSGKNITDLAINYKGDVLGIVIDNGSASTVILYDLVNERELKRYDVDSKVADLKNMTDFLNLEDD